MPFASTLIRSMCISALGLFAGCTEPNNQSSSLAQMPTSIAYWQKTDKFITGSFDKAELVTVDRTGSLYSAIPAGTADGRNRALRLAVDEERQRLWVAQFNAVLVYELPKAAEPMRIRAAY